MNRNVESHFAELPSVDVPRSIFDRSKDHLTSFNVGELIPFYCDPTILPGDTYNVTTSFVARLQTLLTPIFGNVYLETFWFFIPYRLCWSHWKEFMGENSDSAWIPQVTYSMPKIESPDNGWNSGTIADYLGIPPGVEFKLGEGTDNLAPDALIFRAYALVCNEWFRDQNLTSPLNIPLGDSNQTGSNGSSFVNDVANGGKPFKVAKYHDLFTSCLPAPQKGNSVSFGVNPQVSVASNIPVFAGQENVPTKYLGQAVAVGRADGVAWSSAQNLPLVAVADGLSGTGNLRNSSSISSGVGQVDLTFRNLYADVDAAGLSVSGVSFTINELRLAFQLQKFYERLARGGSRYREIIKSMFSVTSPDARMMVPEYLGGHRVPIQIHQVVNNASSSGEYLGDLGAMSNTADVHEDFVKSFTEHGVLLGLACVRYDHSYSQGLPREYVHDSYLDYFWPLFDSIGEQPIFKYELDATQRANENRMEVFGYNEAWAHYRFCKDSISGEMRPGVSNSLAHWHLGDDYSAMPALSDAWIREDLTNLDRCLAVTSSVSNQVFADFYVKNIATRPMAMYSIPGLIDHH